jgi:hypothetical protein
VTQLLTRTKLEKGQQRQKGQHRRTDSSAPPPPCPSLKPSA